MPKRSLKQLMELDLRDAYEAVAGAMDAIARAQDHLALGRIPQAQLVLARAQMADAGGIDWCEV